MDFLFPAGSLSLQMLSVCESYETGRDLICAGVVKYRYCEYTPDTMQRLIKNYTEERTTRRQHNKHDLVTLSDLPKKWQQFCDGTTPRKFSYETENWAFDARGRPICQYCGVIDDRHVRPDTRAATGDRRKTGSE